MSLHALDLEDFGAAVAASDPATPAIDPREIERQTAWEDGFAAGREAARADTAAEAETSAAALTDALQARIQELGFSFHEARAHVMQSVAPMLRVILSQALPQVLHATLAARLEREFAVMIEAHGEAPVMLRLTAADRARFADALEQGATLPLTLVVDDTLAEGELVLRLGEIEREIDIAGFSTRLTEILDTMSHTNEGLLRHG